MRHAEDNADLQDNRNLREMTQKEIEAFERNRKEKQLDREYHAMMNCYVQAIDLGKCDKCKLHERCIHMRTVSC